MKQVVLNAHPTINTLRIKLTRLTLQEARYG